MLLPSSLFTDLQIIGEVHQVWMVLLHLLSITPQDTTFSRPGGLQQPDLRPARRYLQDVVQQRDSGLVGLRFRQFEQSADPEAFGVARVSALMG